MLAGPSFGVCPGSHLSAKRMGRGPSLWDSVGHGLTRVGIVGSLAVHQVICSFFLPLSSLLLSFYPRIICSDRLCLVRREAIALSKPALRTNHPNICFINPHIIHKTNTSTFTCASGKEISVLQPFKRGPSPLDLALNPSPDHRIGGGGVTNSGSDHEKGKATSCLVWVASQVNQVHLHPPRPPYHP